MSETVESAKDFGTAVIVNGVVVAWFANFDESAADWCRENHFGEWLTWQAKSPDMRRLSEEEYDSAVRVGEEMFRELCEG